MGNLMGCNCDSDGKRAVLCCEGKEEESAKLGKKVATLATALT